MSIRRLTVFERDAVRDFYLALSADDRRKRFCCVLSDDAISKYVDELNFMQHSVIGAFNEYAQLIGLAELAPGAKESELAFSVRADMRCQGLGTKLMTRILVYAKISGARKVTVMFLSDNRPMRKLAEKFGLEVRCEDGEAYASRELPAPTAAELARWFMQENLAHGEYFSVLGIERWGSLVTQSRRPTSQGCETSDALAA